MNSDHGAAGPCDPFLGGWEDRQAARSRFFADRAAEALAYAEERRGDEVTGRESAPVAAAAATALRPSEPLPRLDRHSTSAPPAPSSLDRKAAAVAAATKRRPPMTPEHEYEHEYPAAGPCDLPAYGWADYERARERFLQRLAAQARAASAAPRPAAESQGRGDPEPAPVAAVTPAVDE